MKIKKIEIIKLDHNEKFYDIINANPYNNFMVSVGDSYICSHNCDEISFQTNSDIEKQKKKAMELVSSASARMQSRFMKGEKNPTCLILASSKRTEQSFLETFIDNKKKNESKTTLVVDEPQWVIRTDKDSKSKFKVAVGNKFLNSEVVPLDFTEQDLEMYKKRGYTLLDVPMGYYENFIDDIDIALTDIAGISTSSISRYISGSRLSEVIHKEFKNGFVKDIIEVGDSPEDNAQYYDFFNLENIDKQYMDRPMFIHLDMSISGDKTGIAGTWIIGKKPPEEGKPASRELLFRPAFVVSVKAPKGHQISFEKNRQFIYWLKEQGFAIKGVSSDTFQSYDLLQQIKTHGFNTDIVSVDRLEEQICKPYQYLKSVIYEKRIELFQNNLLFDEIIGLERNNNSGKIDHGPSGVNSKDASDALCGSIWNASQHAEEYEFDYGETLDIIQQVSAEENEYSRNQITVDFEQELAKLHDPLNMRSARQSSDGFMDFGMGKAQAIASQYLSNGIILW